ncbi:hypothetical protein E2C01_084599 [Portunus trituberculatus]|uniref:Uncharacterized protein n=1 Tax=Portunus trituberculatus TaxID=210409 RepID=A0A5B7J4G2_PORTR|nr:hypothetical protein [Portunus trituberculatus]
MERSSNEGWGRKEGNRGLSPSLRYLLQAHLATPAPELFSTTKLNVRLEFQTESTSIHDLKSYTRFS